MSRVFAYTQLPTANRRNRARPSANERTGSVQRRSILRVLDNDSKLTPRRHLMPVDDDSMLRPPPHSSEAEQAILGAILLDNDVAESVRALVAVDDFYVGAHREIFRHIDRLISADRPADVITVAESLKAATQLDYVGGMPYLLALAQGVPVAANAAHYAVLVAERARRRAIIVTAAEIGQAAAASSAPASAVILSDARERLDGLTRQADDIGPLPLDLTAMAAAPVPERRFRVGRIMPRGAPGLWTGHGGAGKTQAALHLAICLALERNFFGEPVAGDRVAFVSTEDDAADLHYRLAQQIRLLGATLDELDGRLFLYDYTAVDPVLVTSTPDGIVTTPRYAALRTDLRRQGVGVVFLDNFSTLCAVDLIKPAHATQAIALCDALVPNDGNAVLIAHVDKATAKAGHSREAYSGTAAFHNRARWRWYLFAPNAGADAEPGEEEASDDGRRILEVQKVNAGRSGTRIALRILDNGAIAPDGVDDGIAAAITRRSERAAVLASIGEAQTRQMPVPAARSGSSTAYEVLCAMPSYPNGLRGKAGKRRLLAVLTQVQADGEIEPCEFAGPNRHKRDGYRLAQVVK